ncbi:hypothetical protein FQN52_008343 [Onygenales sp. PD_12]|nr:hypothetical protein FQN52_008343 [Onygenales sp. PD_12]KAK2787062.1 hypothetical protein FQN53_005762 [Emmonsiellopsis sp. PD_33]
MLGLICTTAAILGISSHQLLFKHGEWDRYAPKLGAIFVFTPLLVSPVLTVALTGLSIYETLLIVSAFWTSYFAGLLGSICVYRIWFHPLRAFPGPLARKVTAFTSMKSAITGFKAYLRTGRLHEEYGDFVRIRPREISINLADAVRDIHGPTSVCVKGPLYDISYPSRSLQQIRDKAAHSKQRRAWDRGFSMKALATYEPRVLAHCAEILSQLSTRSQNGTKPVEISQWLDYFGFDVMGDLAFGKSFNMAKSGDAHYALKQMENSRTMVGALMNAPWTFNLLLSLPFVSGVRTEWVEFCKKQLTERIQLGTTRADLFSHLIDPTTSKVTSNLIVDTELAIVAGSDTTSFTITGLIYLLATNPAKQALLQRELDTLFTDIHDISNQKLAAPGTAPFLEGCINEALRLYPAVASGTPRLTPPAGATIAGRFVPGDTLVSTPTWVMQRDARNFPSPNEFIPERWSSSPHLITHREAFNPFNAGPYGCVGKALAWMEMRLLVGLVFRRFEVRLGGEDGGRGGNLNLFDDGFRDYFTAKAPEFEIVLVERG